ncbi:MAG: glycosyltransferase family 2 protein, partial [Gemmatimonadaceae bacterium]
PENPFATASQIVQDVAYAHHNREPERARFFASNNMAVDRATFVRLRGFDPAFRIASEDRDLCERWHEHGHRLVYAPDAGVAHAHRLTLRCFWSQHFRYGRGAWRFHRALRRRGHGRFARDLTFHARFLQRAAYPLSRRNGHGRVKIAALLAVWQVANFAGFLFEGAASRLKTPGPATKIS